MLARPVRREERGRLGAVLGGDRSAERVARADGLGDLASVLGQLEPAGGHEPGVGHGRRADGVDPDPERRGLDGDRLGELVHRPLVAP